MSFSSRLFKPEGALQIRAVSSGMGADDETILKAVMAGAKDTEVTTILVSYIGVL
jgi:lactam utilization protein B